MIRLLFGIFRRLQPSQSKQLFKVVVAIVVMIAFSSSGFMFFELAAKPNLSWLDAIWWSVVTMTTVGYGDLFPETVGGRYVIGVPTMMVGISILGYLLSTVATFLIEARSKELKGMRQQRLSNHILVIHFQSLDRIKEVVDQLRADSKTVDRPIVLIDDELEELPPLLEALGVQFVRGCPTKESTLELANFREASHAVVLARDVRDPITDNHTLAVALTLEKLHGDIVTVAECLDPERVDLMQKSGCDSVVCIAQLSSAMMVQELLDPGVQRVLQELTSTTYGQQIFMLPISDLKEHTFGAVTVQLADRDLLALGVERANNVTLNPERSYELAAGDLVICLGKQRPDSLRL